MSEDLKKRLRKGEACIGAWLTLSSAEAADALVSCGFDWIAVDLHHTTISLENAEACFIAAERWGVAPMARLPNADPMVARRLLDAGAVGLIIPEVEDPEKFADFASHCLYPPHGKRGVGLSRCNGYGASFDEYFSNFQPVLIPQIESRAGVEAGDALAAMDAVDGLFIGPYDLSADLGCPGDLNAPELQDAIARVREATDKHGKALGTHQVTPNPDELDQRIDEGYQFVAYATDVIAMRSAFERPGKS